ncbi:TetR/AcrR family transcriptional regulator [Winogradskyella sediminis]|uniref:DNA-binding transcriptional regulator, AcrR family n=1 Tax=Winogradskyella sediminis TaxID=1382466 RepID=A0A1H1U2G4_9FLAO|nr:TetR/AcrR family transcriptional regulator [Winogradskyella sediminis]SDS66682.1 DNA-binding transcriptional regulator, AcrR family [Winogradskyella sediminis]
MKGITRKEEIITTAAKLFKEKGYSAVTMRDLAKAMGIKAASLYNHINSKQDILKAIIISLAEEFTEGMQLIQSSNDSCIDKLKKIIELHVKISSQNIYGMASLNNDWMHLEEHLKYYQRLRDDYENDFRDILKSGIASGEIIDIKPEVMLFSILTTLRSLYLWIPKKEDVNLDELSNSLSQILIKGINI